MMEITALKVCSSNPSLGLIEGRKYKVFKRFIAKGIEFFQIVSDNGRHYNVRLDARSLAEFNPVYKAVSI